MHIQNEDGGFTEESMLAMGKSRNNAINMISGHGEISG